MERGGDGAIFWILLKKKTVEHRINQIRRAPKKAIATNHAV